MRKARFLSKDKIIMLRKTRKCQSREWEAISQNKLYRVDTDKDENLGRQDQPKGKNQ